MNALFLGTLEDKEYLSHLKSFFGGTTTYVSLEPINLLTQLVMYCEKRSITKVASTSTAILSKLLEISGVSKTEPSLDNYAGSLFTHKNISIVFVPPLKQLLTVNYGKFLCKRFISKVVTPDRWTEATEFKWEMIIERGERNVSMSAAIA